MLKTAIKVIQQYNHSAEALNNLHLIATTEILVGIPEETTSRSGQSVTNAELAFLHTNGFTVPRAMVLKAYRKRFIQAARNSKKVKAIDAMLIAAGNSMMNVPPRPFLQPAIEANKLRIAALYADIFKSAFEGDKQKVLRQMEKLGTFAQNAVKAWFTDPRNGWPPNANWVAKLKGSNAPLIDTGALRQSIRYVVRQK